MVTKTKIKKKKTQKVLKYYEAVGRRKTAVARVRLYPKGEKGIIINNRTLEEYFPLFEYQKVVKDPLLLTGSLDKVGITAVIKGGGITAQAEACRHGISRALVLYNPDFKKKLRDAGFLTRDPRMRERKKFGLKRARRAPQWQKR